VIGLYGGKGGAEIIGGLKTSLAFVSGVFYINRWMFWMAV